MLTVKQNCYSEQCEDACLERIGGGSALPGSDLGGVGDESAGEEIRDPIVQLQGSEAEFYRYSFKILYRRLQ